MFKSDIVTVEDYLRRYQPKLYRAKEIKHAAALARAAELARLQVRREHKRGQTPTRAEALRRGEGSALIRTAAKEAGRDNRLFCELLNQRGVPVPRSWRVGSWIEAYGKPALHSAIRGVKLRALRSHSLLR